MCSVVFLYSSAIAVVVADVATVFDLFKQLCQCWITAAPLYIIGSIYDMCVHEQWHATLIHGQVV